MALTIIRISGLPEVFGESEQFRQELFAKIRFDLIAAVATIEELGIPAENVEVYFEKDLLQGGRGKKIFVEVLLGIYGQPLTMRAKCLKVTGQVIMALRFHLDGKLYSLEVIEVITKLLQIGDVSNSWRKEAEE